MKPRQPRAGDASPTRLVYSTDTGRICPGCRRPVAACVCHVAQAAPAADGIVRVGVETKGRKGKAVTVIKGVPLDAIALAEFGKVLRTTCGCGGTTKDGVIELQGDHAARATLAMQAAGWTIKRIGG